jgi:hypothetical protein
VSLDCDLVRILPRRTAGVIAPSGDRSAHEADPRNAGRVIARRPGLLAALLMRPLAIGRHGLCATGATMRAMVGACGLRRPTLLRPVAARLTAGVTAAVIAAVITMAARPALRG